MGLIEAIKLFFAALGGRDFVDRGELDAACKAAAEKAAAEALASVPPPVEKPDRFDEGAVYTLVLMQREGRLVDFLQESIDGYGDADVGRAVRQIHAGCRKVLVERFAVEPVMKDDEGSAVTVPATFNALEIQLTGSVPDGGPYKGRLAHKGWRAGACKFPARTGEVDPKMIKQAEVEVG